MDVARQVAGMLRARPSGHVDGGWMLLFGQPKEDAGKTVIPVAETRDGAKDAAGDSHEPRPLGRIEIRGDRADFVPAGSRRTVALITLAVTLAVAGIVAWRSRR